MTLCAYLSPQDIYGNIEFPVLITDCLVTTQGIHNALTPENIEHEFENSGVPKCDLSSKFFLLDRKSIISFAGNLQQIQDFMQEFPDFFDERHMKERPMKYAAETIDQFNATRNGPDIAAIGCGMVEKEGRRGFNWFAPTGRNPEIKTAYFGMCHAIGSGSEQFIEWLESTDQNIPITHSVKQRNNKLSLMAGSLGLFNNDKFFGNNSALNSWGGYLQTMIFPSAANTWVSFGSWLHCCIHVHSIDPFSFTWRKKFLLYKPNADASRPSSLAAVIPTKEFGMKPIVWPILSPFTGDTKAECSDSDWVNNFHPDFVTISFDATEIKEIQGDAFTHTLNPDERVQVNWQIQNGNLPISVPDELLQKIVLAAVAILNTS